MSTFDADSFLNQEIDANFDSEYTPVPEGEFEAQVDKIDIASYTVKEGRPDAGQEKPILKLTWAINDPSVSEETGIETPKVQQTVFLDFSNGVLETGANKNIMLGKLREIGDLTEGDFRLTDLAGINGVVSVKHRITDDGRPMAEVKNVAEL